MSFSKLLITFILLFTVSVSRAVEIKKSFRIPDLELREAVTNYYNNESNKKWKITYSYRPPSFREIVNISVYKKLMNKHSRNWSLENIEITNVEHISNTQINIQIRFFSIRDNTGVQIQEETIWKKMEQWKAVNPGARLIFPLNDLVVDEIPDA